MLNLRKTKEKLSECIVFLKNIEETDLSFALVNLFKTIIFEIEIIDNKNFSLAEEALRVRNVFELYLISKYIYKDNSSLEKWILQIHKDTEDLINGFLKLAVKNSMSKEHQRLEKVKNEMHLIMTNSGCKSEKSFNMRTVSEELGYADDYDSVYKMSSKIIHPTSMRVNQESYQSMLRVFKEILIISLEKYCLKIEDFVGEIMIHFSKIA